MAKRVAGSYKNKVVASDLQEERDKLAFDFNEFRVLMNGGEEVYKVQKEFNDMVERHPALHNTFEFYDMTPHEAQTHLWEKIKYIEQNIPELFKDSKVNEYPFFFWMNRFQGLLPGIGLHYTMF